MGQRRVRGNSFYDTCKRFRIWRKELDDVPPWRKEGGSECMVGEKLCTEQRQQLEMLLQKVQE